LLESYKNDEKIDGARRLWSQYRVKARMMRHIIVNDEEMIARTEDVIARLNSMLIYVKTINEHAVNTPCSQDKVKEATIKFFSEQIEKLKENIQEAYALRMRLIEG
jgi:hypothetical protein